MYTRCPACEALYELGPEELAEAAGVVRCSNCGKTFNSLASLFKGQPETGESPLRGKGMPPLLAHRILLQPALPGFDADAEGAAEAEASSVPPAPGQSADPAAAVSGVKGAGPGLRWPLAAALLAILALAQGLWLFDGLDHRFGSAGPATPAPVPADALVVVARDMHAHPTLDNAVVISASVRNQSNATMEYPVIELRLFDRSNQALGAVRLDPEDYLEHPARAPGGLAPGLVLPMIIEVTTPGSRPTGFELRFF